MATRSALAGSNSFLASGMPEIVNSIGVTEVPGFVVATVILAWAGMIERKGVARISDSSREIFFST